jgi:dihydrofolate reductase
MRKIFLFMMVSVDGFFEGKGHDLSWHNTDEEFVQFAVEQLEQIDTILFGRVTYEIMAEFWPSEEAKKADPETARLMTSTPKIVFSHNEMKPEWNNTTWMQNIEGLKTLKEQEGKDLAVFGSNNLCVSLLRTNLLDEVRVMVNPVVIGQGHTLFTGLNEKLRLRLLEAREFGNGNILLTYQLAK